MNSIQFKSINQQLEVPEVYLKDYTKDDEALVQEHITELIVYDNKLAYERGLARQRINTLKMWLNSSQTKQEPDE